MKNNWLSLLLIAGATSGLAQQAQTQLVTRDQPYRLHASDVIELEYVFTPEYNQVVTVGPDGSVRLKLLGGLKVAGMTLDEATAAITQKAAGPLNNPELTLTLKDYVKPHFTVSGQVERPGVYDMHGSVTFLQAIAMSGGLKDFSKENKVVLVRKENEEFAEVRVIDLKKLSQTNGVKEDFNLRPDDMILVPKNALGKVEPYVRVASQGLTSLYGVQILK
jgi:protein involved in polysaccharide export with SLBB domain